MREGMELKPCPFCGGEADYSIGEKGDGTPWDYVECLECGATTEPEIWNKRTALEAEKPAEDSALSAVERWADEYYERPVLVGEVHRSLAVAFQSYAHSYHLAQCAKCKALPEDDVSEREA